MKYLIYLCLFWILISGCKKADTRPDPVLPEIPAATAFLKGVDTTYYGENALVQVYIKTAKLETGTSLNIDWGDNNYESMYLTVREGFPANTRMELMHRYTRNGNYKVRLRATNKNVNDSLAVVLSVTNKVPPPVADFAYEILDGGKVRFKSVSEGKIAYTIWGDNKTLNKASTKDAEFIYEKNGDYLVTLIAGDAFGQSAVAAKMITVTNAIPRERAYFKGVFLGESFEWVENGEDCVQSMREIDPGISYLIYSFSKNSDQNLKRYLFDVLCVFKVPSSQFYDAQERYNKFKEQLTVGVKKVGSNVSGAWNVTLYKREVDKSMNRFMSEDPNALIEILEVKEVDQPVLFESVYPKSFWVTFRLKADLKEAGKIDGELKIRYMIYKQ